MREKKEEKDTLRPFCRFYGTSQDGASQLINLLLTTTKYNSKHLEVFFKKINELKKVYRSGQLSEFVLPDRWHKCS